jgi:maltose alpha-D-glucosyltransferase/alpha-amylase
MQKLVGLFTLEKALYEVRYELDNRPDWLYVPVEALDELAGSMSNEAAESEAANEQ